MDAATQNPVYAFADYCLDPTRRLVTRGGEPLVLHPKAFDLLVTLIENRDRVLSKSELLDKVWPGQFVEESNLAVQIFALRKIFGEKREEHRFIITVPGKGYRFVAEVSAENRPAPDFDEAEPAGHNSNRTGFSAAAGSEAPEKQEKSEKSETPETPEKSVTREVPPARSYFEQALAVMVFLAIALSLIFYWRAGRDEQPSGAKHLKLAKLTTSGKIADIALTPDGKYLVFAQKEENGESLWLRHLATGSQTRIVEPEPLEYVGLAVSPDNNFIYYSTFEANQSDTLLHRMPLLGGASQEIRDIDAGVSVTFSPDGTQFAYTEASSSLKEGYLKIAGADGANRRVLIRVKNETRTFPNFKSNPVAWSPSGEELACSVIEKQANGAKAGILLVNPVDGNERLLLAPQFDWIENLVWTDAENLAFIAYEAKGWTSQIWTISRKTGQLRQITNDLNSYLRLASAGGNLLSVQQNAVSGVLVADFDENLKELEPREIVHEAHINYAAFAPDNSILYTSRTSGKLEIWRVSHGSANPAQLTTDAEITAGFSVSPVDGSIVFSSIRGGGKRSLWLADAAGKNFRRLTDGDDDIFPQFTRDGKNVVFQRGYIDSPTVWRVSLDGRPPVQLLDKHSLKPTVSPDGRQTAYYFMDKETDGAWRIGLISTATGEFLGKLSFPQMVNERRMRWHPGGKFLAQIFNKGEATNLLLLPTGGGEPKTISGLGKGSIESFEWSPDGRQIVFTQTVETQDAVLLTDF